MAIYEDQQIHTKTGSRQIKSQDSRSSPHTHRMHAYNKSRYYYCVRGLTDILGLIKMFTLCPSRVPGELKKNAALVSICHLARILIGDKT